MARKDPLVKPYSIYFVKDAMGKQVTCGIRSLPDTKERLELIANLSTAGVLSSEAATPPFQMARLICP